MTLRILMVEDEALVRGVVADELRECGHEVIEAADGAEAMAFLAEQRFDVLFTDIVLPGGTHGWAIAEAARSLDPDMPVVYATGYSGTEPRTVPGSRLLMKPYRVRAVLAAFRELGLEPENACA